MAKQSMKRSALKKPCANRDMHIALSLALEYVHKHYGVEAVRECLRDFAHRFYAPLRIDLKKRGLVAIKEHIERLYQMEGGDVELNFKPSELRVSIPVCPAVQYLRSKGVPVARLFFETTRTINEAICEGTPYAAEVVKYDRETGFSVQRFYRWPP
jgi:hypothetical protein